MSTVAYDPARKLILWGDDGQFLTLEAAQDLAGCAWLTPAARAILAEGLRLAAAARPMAAEPAGLKGDT